VDEGAAGGYSTRVISILLVEDDAHKRQRVVDVLLRVPGITLHDVGVCQDLISARDRLATTRYDLLILDLRIPNRLGDDPDDSGGSAFVKEITLSRTLIKPFHVIGLTAFAEVFDKSDPVFVEELWRIIRYDPGTVDWERQLISKVEYLVASKQEFANAELSSHLVDIAIITALREPELEAVLDLSAGWVEARHANDSTIYHVGAFERDGKRLKVVAAAAHQMGMPAAAVLTMKVIGRFRPRYLMMVGIAAGIRGAVKIGDVLIADQCWDYGSGKRRVVDGKPVLLPDPKSIPLALDIKERFQHIQAEGQVAFAVESRWRGKRPDDSRLRIVIGPLASGASVVQDETAVEEIKVHSRKLSAIDMEAYGLMYAAENATKPRPSAVVLKGICDFADERKVDDWQKLAAFASANVAYEYCLSEIEEMAGKQ
jgi:nucleoside phosphorylase